VLRLTGSRQLHVNTDTFLPQLPGLEPRLIRVAGWGLYKRAKESTRIVSRLQDKTFLHKWKIAYAVLRLISFCQLQWHRTYAFIANVVSSAIFSLPITARCWLCHTKSLLVARGNEICDPPWSHNTRSCHFHTPTAFTLLQRELFDEQLQKNRRKSVVVAGTITNILSLRRWWRVFVSKVSLCEAKLMSQGNALRSSNSSWNSHGGNQQRLVYILDHVSLIWGNDMGSKILYATGGLHSKRDQYE